MLFNRILSFTLIYIFLIFAPTISQAQSLVEHFREGKEFYRAKEYDDAIKNFQEILNVDPYFDAATYQLAYCYYHIEEYQKALETIERCYEYKAIDNNYFHLKAQCYDKLGQSNLSLEYLEFAILHQKINPYYHSFQGVILMEKRQYKGALNAYNNAILHNPTSYGLYYNRGIAKFNLKNKSGACADWYYGKEESKGCEQLYFFRCSNLNVSSLPKVKTPIYDTEFPQFEMGDYSNFYYTSQLAYKYPEEAYLNEVQGTTVMAFTLTKDGLLTDFKPLFSISPLLDSTVIHLIKSTEHEWTPAKENGENIDFHLILPVNFRITEDVDREATDLAYIQNKAATPEELQKAYSRLVKDNPFNFELSKQYAQFLTQNKLVDTTINLDWRKNLDLSNYMLLTEIVSDNYYVKLYFDSDWQVSTKEYAKYYRITKWDNSVHYYDGSFRDFYVNGELYTTGKYENGRKQDDFNFYFPSGSIKTVLHFDFDKPIKTWEFYHANSTLNSRIEISGNNFTVLEYMDTSGNSLMQNGNGNWEYHFSDYSGEKQVKVEGSISNYSKDKTWRLYIDDKLEVDEYYKKSRFEMGTIYSQQGNEKVKEPLINSWIFYPSGLLRAEEVLKSPKLVGNEYFKLFSKSNSYTIL